MVLISVMCGRDQLREVLVAGGDQPRWLPAARAPACRWRRRPRCRAPQHRPAQQAHHLVDGLDLLAPAARHRRAVRPCTGYQVVAEGRALGVEHAGGVLGRRVRSRSHFIIATMPWMAPVGKAVRARRSGHGVVGAVEVAGPVDQQHQWVVAHRRIVARTPPGAPVECQCDDPLPSRLPLLPPRLARCPRPGTAPAARRAAGEETKVTRRPGAHRGTARGQDLRASVTSKIRGKGPTRSCRRRPGATSVDRRRLNGQRVWPSFLSARRWRSTPKSASAKPTAAATPGTGRADRPAAASARASRTPTTTPPRRAASGC